MKKAASLLFLVGAFACIGAGGASGGTVQPVPDFLIPGSTKSSLLPECAALPDPGRRTCYIRGLLSMVEGAGNPARELPRIDRRVHANGGFLEAWCHMFMHEVGRTWARRQGVTLENVYRFVPRSNDAGCSAGFGMGLVMHLGGELVARPRVVLRTCSRLPTRFREYTCVHGSGHALMRGFHGDVKMSVEACETLGARSAPDCAQGAYHDYWISLGGGDGTKRPRNAVTDPRSLCGSSPYPVPCWYRYFLERRPSARVDGSADLRRLCGRLQRLQRSGCLASASLLMATRRDPSDHAATCTELSGHDVMSCLRGVNVPGLAKTEWEQFRLLSTCARLPRATRYGCYVWFGRTLTIVTDGRFGRSGCRRLQTPVARFACAAGARRVDQPLRTFS